MPLNFFLEEHTRSAPQRFPPTRQRGSGLVFLSPHPPPGIPLPFCSELRFVNKATCGNSQRPLGTGRLGWRRDSY